MQEEAVVTPKPKRKVVLTILSTIGWAVIGLLFLVASVNLIDKVTKYSFPFFGLRANVILSESMAYDKSHNTEQYEFHQLQVNDVVVTYQCSYDDINVGDIVIYNSAAGLICHRVIDKYQ